MGEAWNINSSGNQPAPPQRRPGQAEARAGAGAAENAETREQKLTDLMTVATTRPNESGEILSQFNERLFPMLIPNTIPRFRKMVCNLLL